MKGFLPIRQVRTAIESRILFYNKYTEAMLKEGMDVRKLNDERIFALEELAMILEIDLPENTKCLTL